MGNQATFATGLLKIEFWDFKVKTLIKLSPPVCVSITTCLGASGPP